MLKTFQEKAFKTSLKRLNNTERQLAQIYKGSLTDLRNKLLVLSEKIESKTMTDSDLYKYNRLSKMYENTMVAMKDISKQTYDIIKKSNKDVAKIAYEGSRIAYNKVAGIDIGRIDTESLRKMVEFSYPEVPFKDFVNKLGANGITRLKQTLGAGLAQGESIPKISARLKDALNITFNDAVRIARTEALRANSEAMVDATEKAKENGIKIKKVWQHNILSQYARESHIALDGVEEDKDGLFWSNGLSAPAPRMFNDAGEDINCGCSYIEEIIED